MWIASSIFAVVIGAILRYGINESVREIDFATIGTIIMVAGAFGFVAAVIAEMMQRRRTVDREVQGPDGAYVERSRHSV